MKVTRISYALPTFLALQALLIPSVPAHASPGWLAICPYDHSLKDDPIVFPNQPGASHLHDFFGAKDGRAASTYNSMLDGGTSCAFADDTAGYWTPALYRNGVPVFATGAKPLRQQVYYRKDNLASGTHIRSFPKGLKMVVGNMHATSEADNPKLGSEIYWGCSDNSVPGKPKAPPTSCSTGIITLHLGFPNCWDGVHLDSPDHKSHVVFPKSGLCPADHPVPLPRLIIRWEYPVSTTTGNITLSSGPYYTAHADFWNTWDQATLDELVNTCLNGNVDCGKL